ncbi:MAG: IclR family transcriptional regulator [Clostridia bacterium]|nr:IclR family transcriptional regulator [Clostridia bacterium]
MGDVIQSVDRALEMLIYLGRQEGAVSVTKVAADLDIYKSTAFRTLSTLEARGFVEQDSVTEKYSLGRRLFTLGKSVERSMGLQELVRPYARKLCEAYGETVNLSVLERDPYEHYRSVIILKEESWHSSVDSAPVGAERECHCSSVGKCLLAFSPNIDLSVYAKKPMAAHTERTITSPEALKAELNRVRLEGYAVDREELAAGLTCIASPILNGEKEAVASISLSGPTSRMIGADLEERVEAVRRAAREISKKLNG